MLLSSLEIQPLFATLTVLLDNCSSLFDCWDTLGAAAAAAVGAGAAAVFVGGLLLSPGEGTGIAEESAPPVADTVAAPHAAHQGGTVAQATAPTQQAPPGPPTIQPAPVPAPIPGSAAAPGAPFGSSPATPAPAGPVAPQATGPATPQGAATPGGGIEAAPVEAALPPGVASSDPTLGAAPADVAPTAPATPTTPAPATPVAPPAIDPGLAAGLAAGVAPVISTLKTVVASATGGGRGAGTDRDTGSQDEEDLEDGVRCPEVDASHFGLPDINTRQDCPGARPGMPPSYAGIDFTSNDHHGRSMELPFEAGVTGEVTYVGGAFNSVQVTLENGNRIQFLHASRVLAQLGQQVEPTTVLGRTGGTGPYGPNHYEIHLHVQAFDQHGNLIDPDCAVSGGENRLLRRKVAPPEPAREAPSTPGATAVLSGTQPLTATEVPQPYIQAPPPTPSTPPQVMPQARAEIRCARCGNFSPANARFCPWCGQTFAQAAAPVAPPQAPLVAPPPVSPPPAASAPPQTIYCGNCGQANGWGSLFCGRCGAKIAY